MLYPCKPSVEQFIHKADKLSLVLDAILQHRGKFWESFWIVSTMAVYHRGQNPYASLALPPNWSWQALKWYLMMNEDWLKTGIRNQIEAVTLEIPTRTIIIVYKQLWISLYFPLPLLHVYMFASYAPRPAVKVTPDTSWATSLFL